MPAPCAHWLQNLRLLAGPGQAVATGEALISTGGDLLALGDAASVQANALNLQPQDGQGWLLAPTLVDPHSVLEQPLLGRAESLNSLAAAAARGGYGQVALLPWGLPPRDHPDHLGLSWPEPLRLHLWASLSQDEADQELSPHSELLAAGAIGLAGGPELGSTPLLQRSLQLGETGDKPLLLAPRQRSLNGGGLVRERVQALRAGWPIDPVCSETLPLATLISLQHSHPQRRLVAMNLSTAEAVEALGSASCRPLATVHWWHLFTDSGVLHPTSNGWRLEPPLGGPGDRAALRDGLAAGVITAAAVHHQALDAEEQLLPIDQRRVGLAGHGVVLPLLWQALVQQDHWPIERLWQILCWGPCNLLGLAPEVLEPGSRRWLLFDPQARWPWPAAGNGSLAANQPLAAGTEVQGLVRASGLLPSADWRLD